MNPIGLSFLPIAFHLLFADFKICSPRMWQLFKEFFLFLRQEKKWWLVPMVALLLLLGALIVFSSSSILAPLIYPFF
jgi:hypothetical protein